MFHGLRVFHHRSGSGPDHTAVDSPTSASGATDDELQHRSHVWTRHSLEERRSKKRDESFRGLMELEAELVYDVEREA